VVRDKLPIPKLRDDTVAEDTFDIADKNKINGIAGIELDVEPVEGLGGP
jgi:hypothetical protein